MGSLSFFLSLGGLSFFYHGDSCRCETIILYYYNTNSLLSPFFLPVEFDGKQDGQRTTKEPHPRYCLAREVPQIFHGE